MDNTEGFNMGIAQLAGAVECTNYISAEEKDLPPQRVSWI